MKNKFALNNDGNNGEIAQVSTNDGVNIQMHRKSCCPGCRSKNFIFLKKKEYKKVDLIYCICKKCELVFMNPCPTQQWYDWFYSNSFLDEKKTTTILNNRDIAIDFKQLNKEARWATKFLCMLKRANIRVPGGGKILEIGCALGLIARILADEYECEPFGVEPSPAVAKFASNELKVNIIGNSAEDIVKTSERFDLILCSHVLENIVDTRKTINNMKQILKPNGIIIVDTPNLFIQRSFGIFHPYVFTVKSLTNVFLQENFSLKYVWRSGLGKSYFVPRYLTAVFEHSRYPKANNDKIRPSNILFYPKFVAGNLLMSISKLYLFNKIDKFILIKKYPIVSSGLDTIKSIQSKHVYSID